MTFLSFAELFGTLTPPKKLLQRTLKKKSTSNSHNRLILIISNYMQRTGDGTSLSESS